jgi:hypothetical protein
MCSGQGTTPAERPRVRDSQYSIRVAIIVLIATFGCGSVPVWAQPLGSAARFAVLGASTVTNTGSTTLNGDLGVYPGSAITGLGSITFIGASTTHNTPPGLDPISKQAQVDEFAAYNALASQPVTSDLTGHDLGTSGVLPIGTLTPGVYKFSTTAQLNGTLTLDAQNLPGAVFIFQIGTALTTASASSVQIINGSPNIGVYWLLGVTGGAGTGSATLGTTTAFEGNILALDSITLTTGATIVCGRALAHNGAVTMDTNIISNNCNTFNNGGSASDFGSLGFSGGTLAGIPITLDSGCLVSYATNLGAPGGDSFINISNTGASGASGTQSGTTFSVPGSICVNVYAFSPDEQLLSCCSCPVTPNGLVSLSARNDLLTNTLGRFSPNSIVIQLVATQPAGGCANSAAALTGATITVPGLVAWSTTLHANTSPADAGHFGLTEAPLTGCRSSTAEQDRLGTLCAFALSQGSLHGICNSCSVGGLGAAKQ